MEDIRNVIDRLLIIICGLVKSKLKSDVIAFHTEYEMAVITAMCRNDRYDREVISKLKKDLRGNMANTLLHPVVPLYMKGCAVLIAYVHPVFIFLFRILYRMTGR